jgi:hypothetical protein
MEGFSGHVLEWLTTGRIDVAVLYNAPRSNTLMSAPLLTDELFLLGPVNDPAGAGSGPVPAARLANIPLILPSRPHGLRLLVDDSLSRIGVTPNVQVEIDAMPSTLSLVESGAGRYGERAGRRSREGRAVGTAAGRARRNQREFKARRLTRPEVSPFQPRSNIDRVHPGRQSRL